MKAFVNFKLCYVDRFALRLVAPSAILSLLSSTALAQTVFQNPSTGSWFNASNWTAGVPNSATDADVTNGGTAQVDSDGVGAADTLNVGAPSQVQVINGSVLQISGGTGSGPIALDNGTLQSGVPALASNGISNPLVIGTGGGVVDSNGAHSLELTGGISGASNATLTFINTGTKTSSNIDTILSATSTFAGSVVVIGPSNVQVDANNAIGIGSLTVGSGASLIIGSSYSQSVTVLSGSGVVYGNGFRSPTGSGEGTLIVESGIFSGTLDDGHSNDATRNYTGTLQLVKTTTGTLTLLGPAYYSGGTQLQQGTIEVGYNNALGSGTLAMSPGTTLRLVYNNTPGTNGGVGLRNPVTLSGNDTIDTQNVASGLGLNGPISGTGTLVKIGSAPLGLRGVNTYSGGTIIEGSNINIYNNNALGTGQLVFDGGYLRAGVTGLTINNPALLSVNGRIETQSYDLTYSGPISGPGAFTKTGTGNLILSGADTYTGPTTVSAGTLVATGSLVSAVTVDSGASIGGSGTIGNFDVLDGGTLSPGSFAPFSTLHVVGNAVLGSGSTYTVHVNNAGQTDALSVSGTTTIGGGTVSVIPAAGTYAQSNRYTILTATGGVTGQFASVTSSLPYLMPMLSYDPDHVYLNLQLAPGFMSGAAQVHASVPVVAIESGRTVSSAIFDRLWNIPGDGSGDAVSALGQFGTITTNPLLRCYGPEQASAGGTVPATYTVWGQAIGDFFRNGGDSNAASVDNALGGVIFGIDSRVDNKLFSNWRVGISGGYTNDSYTVGQGGGTGTFENAFGALYGGARYGAVDVRLGASYGGTSTTVHRTEAFPGFFEAEKSNNGGDTVQGFGELGYRLGFSQAVFEPILDAGVDHVRQDSYRERGGAAALFGFKQDTDVEFTTLGFRAEATPFAQYPLVARLMLGWEHSYGDINPASSLELASGSAVFNSYGTPLDRDAAVAEANLVWRATPATSVTLAYTGQIGERDRENGIRGRVDYRF